MHYSRAFFAGKALLRREGISSVICSLPKQGFLANSEDIV